MEDWFGETPVEKRELLPSHFENWQFFCSFCGKESLTYFEGKYLCEFHTEETMMEFAE